MVAMVWWVWGISECGGEKEREIRVGRFFYYLTRLYLHFNNNNYVSVCTSRHSRSSLFHHCRVFAHRISKMPSRRMREDAKSFASAQLWC